MVEATEQFNILHNNATERWLLRRAFGAILGLAEPQVNDSVALVMGEDAHLLFVVEAADAASAAELNHTIANALADGEAVLRRLGVPASGGAVTTTEPGRPRDLPAIAIQLRLVGVGSPPLSPLPPAPPAPFNASMFVLIIGGGIAVFAFILAIVYWLATSGGGGSSTPLAAKAA